ncbi:MAG: type III pantothenate kinase [Pyramidobacter sp.]|nr:type III pantothenate kinase [Pyramidobacter sp.]
MFLTVDVGNTNTVFGCYDGSRLLFTARTTSESRKTEDDYAMVIESILRMHGTDISQIDDGIISSVVPVLKRVLSDAFYLLKKKRMLIVSPDLDLGLKICTDNPYALGSDLIVDAVGAMAKYPLPLMIFDLGTATTLSVVDKDACYRGGMIMPGLRISADALGSRTAQLPYINIETPPRLIGTNTVTCMQSGIVYGHAAMIDGLIERTEEELGEPASVIVTGGLAPIITPLCRKKLTLDKDLLLDGLRVLYEKNKDRPRGTSR